VLSEDDPDGACVPCKLRKISKSLCGERSFPAQRKGKDDGPGRASKAPDAVLARTGGNSDGTLIYDDLAISRPLSLVNYRSVAAF